jgi:hypothetical protein
VQIAEHRCHEDIDPAQRVGPLRPNAMTVPTPPPPPALRTLPAGFGGLEIDEQFDLHGLLHRQVRGLFAPQDAADIGSGHTNWFREVGAITHQIADGSGLANLIQVESIEV